MSSDDDIARRARSLIGTAYRPKGRSAAGIDCVGVAAFALDLPAGAVPRAYRRRQAAPAELSAALRAAGLELRASMDAVPGDLLIFDAGSSRMHLGISTGAGFVHADAGLGRVVERPFPSPWPIAGVWRATNPPEPERS